MWPYILFAIVQSEDVVFVLYPLKNTEQKIFVFNNNHLPPQITISSKAYTSIV